MVQRNKVRSFETCRCGNCGSDPSGRRLLSISEAAEYCKVHRNTICRWMKLGLIDWVYPGRQKTHLRRLVDPTKPA